MSGSGARAGVAPWPQVQGCRTLFQMHEALVALRPSDGADAQRWLTYHRRSAAAYERIADIDRGHHHEALYWAQRERTNAAKIASAISRKPDGSDAINPE